MSPLTLNFNSVGFPVPNCFVRIFSLANGNRSPCTAPTATYLGFDNSTFRAELKSIKYSFYLGFTKECIDALFPHEKYGRWGGDGFSKYDLYYDIAGIGLAYLIDKLWKEKKDDNVQCRLGRNNFVCSIRIP